MDLPVAVLLQAVTSRYKPLHQLLQADTVRYKPLRTGVPPCGCAVTSCDKLRQAATSCDKLRQAVTGRYMPAHLLRPCSLLGASPSARGGSKPSDDRSMSLIDFFRACLRLRSSADHSNDEGRPQ